MLNDHPPLCCTCQAIYFLEGQELEYSRTHNGGILSANEIEPSISRDTHSFLVNGYMVWGFLAEGTWLPKKHSGW